MDVAVGVGRAVAELAVVAVPTGIDGLDGAGGALMRRSLAARRRPRMGKDPAAPVPCRRMSSSSSSSPTGRISHPARGLIQTGSRRATAAASASASAPAANAAHTAAARRQAGPERWSRDAGSADVAVLDIPASAQRDRVFEIDVGLTVRSAAPGDAARAKAAAPSHALSVELNGAREWSRHIPTSNPGETDTLDWRCRRVVPLGQALRIRAITQVSGQVQRVRLLVTAEEEPTS
jgi:hypothetical protein